MSPCRQNGLLPFCVSISSPFHFQICVRCSPLACSGEQFTVELLDIHVTSCPAIFGSGIEIPSETLCSCLQHRIGAGSKHVRLLCTLEVVHANASVRASIGGNL